MQNFKSTADNLKQIFKAFERKPSLGAPVSSFIFRSTSAVEYCRLKIAISLQQGNLYAVRVSKKSEFVIEIYLLY